MILCTLQPNRTILEWKSQASPRLLPPFLEPQAPGSRVRWHMSSTPGLMRPLEGLRRVLTLTPAPHPDQRPWWMRRPPIGYLPHVTVPTPARLPWACLTPLSGKTHFSMEPSYSRESTSNSLAQNPRPLATLQVLPSSVLLIGHTHLI